MTLTIYGVDFVVGNVNGDFVWDIGGSNETTITTVGNLVIQEVNSQEYTIWFDGFGSLLFSVKKGNHIFRTASTVLNGRLYNWYAVNNESGLTSSDLYQALQIYLI